MGLYDRDYVRNEAPPAWFGAGQSMVVNLIIVNIAIYVVEALAGPRMVELLSIKASLLSQPWNAWQLLTAGFLHDPDNVFHVLFNMYALWLFGRDVEAIYGRTEFLRLYLALVVLSSLGWVLAANLAYQTYSPRESMIGASGAISGVMVIFVMHYPQRTFLLFGIVPLPAWLLVGLYILQDVFGASRAIDNPSDVAFTAHLSGAAAGFAYRYFGINFGRISPKGWRLPGRRPRLRVVSRETEAAPRDLSARVDEILEKISRTGESSLSREERKLLEEASRKYQARRK